MKRILNTGKMLILALIFVLTTNVVNAQQQIYSGLRVPQLTTLERDQIGTEVDSEAARGKMIFNTDSLVLQYWNGAEWISVKDEQAILEYITNNINNTNLGDSILNFITNNFVVTVDGIEIVSGDNTVTVIGGNTNEPDLRVNIGVIIDSLINNSTFIENLVTNQTFIDSLISNLTNNETFIEELTLNEYFITNLIENLFIDQTFMDSIVNNLFLHEDYISTLIENLFINQTFMDSIVNNLFLHEDYISTLIENLFIDQTFMDSIVNNLFLHEEFVTSITQVLALNITQDLTDSIMANVSITSIDNTVNVTGSGTSNIDLSVNATVIADSIANNFSATVLRDSIRNLIVTNLPPGIEIKSGDNTVTVIGGTSLEPDLRVNMAAIIDSLINNSTFINNLVNILTINETFIEELTQNEYFITNLIENLFLEQTFMDSIVNNLFLHEKFITNISQVLAVNITQELTDSIMANVTIEGDYGITTTGSGTSDIRVQLPQGQFPNDILVWDTLTNAWRPETQAPVWFYMPSIVIDVSQSVTNEIIDLYAEYRKQFNTLTLGHSIIGSQGAPSIQTATRVYEVHELNFYIIGHDASVFYNVSISDTGVMTYSVNASNVSEETFMNIVFVVK
ncbi:MAG: hypothetical protein FWE63_05900 [Bacteroidales bacterium]|nr:hypothetical protein [Bacteroidales bacterium]